MIHNPLHDIDAIVILRSDKVLMKLLEDESPYRNERLPFSESIRDFYSSTFRKEAIEMVQQHSFGKDSDHFDILDTIYDEYFADGRDGDYIVANLDKLERYSALINKVHPYNIIGYRLAKELYKGFIEREHIQTYAETISSLALPSCREEKSYSDNHLHLGGANENILNLLTLFHEKTDPKYYTLELFKKLPRISEFSFVHSGELTFGKMIDIAKSAMSYLHQMTIEREDSQTSTWRRIQEIAQFGRVATMGHISWQFKSLASFPMPRQTTEQFLLAEAVKAYREDQSIQQWFFYNIFLHYLYREYQTNHFLKKMVQIIFHVTNIIRSYQVMSQNIGLGHFSEFFRSKLRQTTKERHNNIAKNIIDSGTTHFEGKISPSAIFDGDLLKYKVAFDNKIMDKEPMLSSREYHHHFLKTNDAKRQYHFCLHFRREEDNFKRLSKKHTLPVRHDNVRQKLKKEGQRLHRYLYEQATLFPLYNIYRKSDSVPTIHLIKYAEQLKKNYIDISKMIIGLDVAGRESLAPPEVYAPTINYLRYEPKPKKWRDYYRAILPEYRSAHHRLRLSVHAGEDFNHIVSGMRRIDETIRFYNMGRHDRLGHAFAIGVDPKAWIHANGDIFVTQLEYLDNLVWLQRYAEEVADVCRPAIKLARRYERFIAKLSRQIYGKSYPSADLYEAWKLRQYCPYLLLSTTDYEHSALQDAYRRAVLPDSQSKPSEEILELYRRYHRNAHVRKEGNKVIRLVFDPTDTGDDLKISFIDLELYEAVQDAMLQKIAEKEIIIEANPSSNIYIAHLNSFEEHPIFRWHPVNGLSHEAEQYNRFGLRKGKVQVCINTDDPAIMPTTLYIEFKQLKLAAKRKGYHLPDIEEWLEELRALGNKIFAHDHQRYEFETKELTIHYA